MSENIITYNSNTNANTYNSSSLIVNKKELMDKRDLARLVDYYRMRVEGFDKERIESLEKLEKLRISQEEQHKNEWELRRRTDEIIELQNALSESSISLNNERKQTIYLTSELENSKLKTKEDRRRLLQLLQLAEPIEQTIKLYYDRRPEKLEKYSNSVTEQDCISLSRSLCNNTGKREIMCSNNNRGLNKVILKNKCKTCKQMINPSSSFNSNYRISPSDEKQHIIRTILLPNEESESKIQDENDYLKNQLNNLKNQYEDHILKMEEDRRLREEEMRLRDINHREKSEDLMKRNQKLEKLNYEVTKDYMQLKYDSSNNEKKLYEELELSKLQNEALSVSIRELMYKSNLDKESNKNDFERRTKEITHVMRSQVKNHEENINIIKEQYKQIQKIYTCRVKELETKLKSLTDKYKTLENRRNFEIEGYINEANLMRKRVKSYEEYLAKARKTFISGQNGEEESLMMKMMSTKKDLNNFVDRLKEESKYNNSNQFEYQSRPNYSSNTEDGKSLIEMEDL